MDAHIKVIGLRMLSNLLTIPHLVIIRTENFAEKNFEKLTYSSYNSRDTQILTHVEDNCTIHEKNK
jgi:hypothetical protein